MSLEFTVAQPPAELVGSSGVEPPTSRLSGARSNLLSYEPLFLSAVLSHFRVGGDDGIRTHDPLLAGQVLSQLSYTPIRFFRGSVSPVRKLYLARIPRILGRLPVVPMSRTFHMQARCSSQLSYTPVFALGPFLCQMSLTAHSKLNNNQCLTPLLSRRLV